MSINIQDPETIGFLSGVQLAIDKIESMKTIFSGYPQNKLTALDVKEFIETEIDMLRGTLRTTLLANNK